jgi:hypothetical protein
MIDSALTSPVILRERRPAASRPAVRVLRSHHSRWLLTFCVALFWCHSRALLDDSASASRSPERSRRGKIADLRICAIAVKFRRRDQKWRCPAGLFRKYVSRETLHKSVSPSGRTKHECQISSGEQITNSWRCHALPPTWKKDGGAVPTTSRADHKQECGTPLRPARLSDFRNRIQALRDGLTQNRATS